MKFNQNIFILWIALMLIPTNAFHGPKFGPNGRNPDDRGGFDQYPHDTDALIGVDLGLKHISAAYFDGDKPVVAMRLLRSQEYQDLMHEAFDTHGNHSWYTSLTDSTGAKEIFRIALEQAKSLANENAPSKMRIGMVTTLDAAPYINKPVSDALEEVETIRRYQDCMQQATRAVSLTFPDSDCWHNWEYAGRWDDEQHDMERVLVIDLAESRISLGRWSLSSSAPGFWLDEGDFHKKVVHDTDETLTEAIRVLVEDSDRPIAKVVISGDVSEEMVEVVLERIGEASPELMESVKVPAYGFENATAVGAACYALNVQYAAEEMLCELGSNWGTDHDEL